MSRLPTIRGLLIPLFLSLRKGVKIGTSDISLSQTYHDVFIDTRRLKAFREYFGFSAELPLSYLYLLAQRAQLALMLDPKFTIAAVGLVHLNNELNLLSVADPELPFDIEVRCLVSTKKEGSLFPEFEVGILQNGKMVATCKSGYIARRKRKGPSSVKKEKPIVPPVRDVLYSDEWQLPKSMGKKYAKISGDYNPIHVSPIVAKVSGFPSMLIHGWYSVSRAVSFVEKHTGNRIDSIDVNFLNPVFLPGNVHLDVGEGCFQLRNTDGGKIYLKGNF